MRTIPCPGCDNVFTLKPGASAVHCPKCGTVSKVGPTVRRQIAYGILIITITANLAIVLFGSVLYPLMPSLAHSGFIIASAAITLFGIALLVSSRE